MTTEAMNGWALTLLELRGGPVPPVPALPGVVHRCADRPGTAAEIADALRDGDAPALGGLIGCSTARARALIAERQQHATQEDTCPS